MELTREQNVLKAVITKAWEDESFKQELINSPLEAIKKATGETVEVPAGKTLVVRDQTSKSVLYINIPAEPKLDDMEMTESQLEAVAGGAAPIDFIGGPIICFPLPPIDCYPVYPTLEY